MMMIVTQSFQTYMNKRKKKLQKNFAFVKTLFFANVRWLTTKMIIVFSQQVAQPQPQYSAHPAPKPPKVSFMLLVRTDSFKSETFILIKFYFDLFNTFPLLLVCCILYLPLAANQIVEIILTVLNSPLQSFATRPPATRRLFKLLIKFWWWEGIATPECIKNKKKRRHFFSNAGQLRCLWEKLVEWVKVAGLSPELQLSLFLMVFVLPKLLVYNVDAMKSYATFSDLSACECRVCASVWAETTTQNVFITVSVAFSEGSSPSWLPWWMSSAASVECLSVVWSLTSFSALSSFYPFSFGS